MVHNEGHLRWKLVGKGGVLYGEDNNTVNKRNNVVVTIYVEVEEDSKESGKRTREMRKVTTRKTLISMGQKTKLIRYIKVDTTTSLTST